MDRSAMVSMAVGAMAAFPEAYRFGEVQGCGNPDDPSQAIRGRVVGWDSGGKRKEPRVGRNDPCPCGSGKKFKKCCRTNGEKR
ncbi:hypothetical protein KOR42_23430 [Thalassoglobus neptunius]|uniref:Preprotein translocase subunit SecA n=1 Tax=Thalassoglobus neptunius TaxID=1938619 RepID=A0A5C5X7D1_9PLAN|nr:SEC-C metal-binding domain-containing protein [Thalassoglobus neptunius]TWT58956.1 hypothetical protein KOR42_23430 [Thalassoglobus neptunius]